MLCVYVCACMHVCVRERESFVLEGEGGSLYLCACVCKCMYGDVYMSCVLAWWVWLNVCVHCTVVILNCVSAAQQFSHWLLSWSVGTVVLISWNCFGGNVWNIFERWCGMHISLYVLFQLHRCHLELKWTSFCHSFHWPSRYNINKQADKHNMQQLEMGMQEWWGVQWISVWERVVCMSRLKFGRVRTWNIGTAFNSYVICFMADCVISLID